MATPPTLPNLPDSFSQPIPQRNTQGLITSLQNQNGPASSTTVATAVQALQHTADGAASTVTDVRSYVNSLSGYLSSFASYVQTLYGSLVTSIIAGTGIGVSGATGNVTVTNTGVTSLVAGTAIGVSGATGAVTVNNTGVTSIVAGTNVTISGGTGAVTVNATTSGVTSLAAGTGIGVSASTGAVTVSNTGVTSLNSLTGAITFPTNPTSWSPTLTMTGGVLTGGSATITATYALMNLFPFIQFNGTFIVSSVSSSVNSFNITLPGGLGAGTPAGVVLYGSILDVTAGAAVVNTGVLLNSSTVAAIGLSIPAVAGHTYTVWIGGWYYA